MGYRSPPKKISQMIGQELGRKIRQHKQRKNGFFLFKVLIVLAIIIIIFLIYLSKEIFLN